MNTMSKKLLAEAFEALANNDMAKATRLFKRNWALEAKAAFHKLEEADESMEVTSMGDDFDAEITDTATEDKEEKINQAILAVEDLENAYTEEISEDMQAKFDDLKSMLDQMKLADNDDEMIDPTEISVLIEDLKGDFEAADAMTEEVTKAFDEIDSVVQGEDADVEIDIDDEDVKEEEPVEEAADEELDVDLEAADDKDETKEEVSFEDETPVESESEEKSEDKEDDLIFDISEKADELKDKIDQLKDVQEDEHLDESWDKAKLPRNKMRSEEEGVKKAGAKFPKGLKIDSKVSMNVGKQEKSETVAVSKPKVEKVENNGKWEKVAKPANK